MPAESPTARELTQAEFCERFKARMLQSAERFNDGSSVADYADETAPSYYTDHYCGPLAETPEECAEADMSYWED